MLSSVRSFFKERGVLEVDCPCISPAAPIDLHIDVLTLRLKGGSQRYLHTSPEYRMKRLLAQGLTEIYQMSHVFREGEVGKLHNPEFTLIEWYRSKLSFEAFIQETLDLIALFLGNLPSRSFTYREIFYKHTGLDYFSAPLQMLKNCLKAKEISCSEEDSWDRDSILNLIMTFIVEPHLGCEEIAIIKDYPASQSALAKTYIKPDGEAVAERFEFYHRGIELGNGYHELTDPVEQRRRLVAANEERIKRGKGSLPIDERFLEALVLGLPDCHGIAVGFDRLLMLRHNQNELSSILPFSWDDS